MSYPQQPRISPPAPRSRRFFWIAGLAAAAAAAIPLIAQKAASDPPASSAKAPAPAGGLRAFKDPVTGEFREPDAAEIQALGSPTLGATASAGGAPRAGRETQPEERAAEIQLPGGGVALKLDDSHLSYSVAKKGPDGKLKYDCVQGSEAARKALETPAPAVSRQSNQAPEVR